MYHKKLVFTLMKVLFSIFIVVYLLGKIDIAMSCLYYYNKIKGKLSRLVYTNKIKRKLSRLVYTYSMYYRRKLLLAIIEKSKNKRINKSVLQYMLYKIREKQEKKYFDFVILNKSLFSFQAEKDLQVLSHHYKYIKELEEEWHLHKDSISYFSFLSEKDKEIVCEATNMCASKKVSSFVNNNHRDASMSDSPQAIANRKKIVRRRIFSLGYEGIFY